MIFSSTRNVSASNDLVPQLSAPPDPEFLIAQGQSDLFRPAIAPGLIVWYTSGSKGLDVYGSRLGSDGHAKGDPFLIAGGAGDQSMPALAVNKKGNYWVVWQDRRNGGAHLYGRYLASDGSFQGDPVAITNVKGDQLRPAVAYSPAADVFLVAWQDTRNSAQPDVYARVLPASSSGALATSDFLVSAAPGSQTLPEVACEIPLKGTLGAGQPRCLIVWQDDRNARRLGTDVMGRMVDLAAGNAIGDKIDVAVEPGYQFTPVAVYNPVSAEYLVTWNDNISGRRVSRAGQPQGSRFPISPDSPFQYKPAIAVGADGAYLVVWEDLRNMKKNGADIYGQWLSKDGLALGAGFTLREATDRHNQYSPTVMFDPIAGAFFFAWEDDRAAGANLAIYGQRVTRASGE